MTVPHFFSKLTETGKTDVLGKDVWAIVGNDTLGCCKVSVTMSDHGTRNLDGCFGWYCSFLILHFVDNFRSDTYAFLVEAFDFVT